MRWEKAHKSPHGRIVMVEVLRGFSLVQLGPGERPHLHTASEIDLRSILGTRPLRFRPFLVQWGEKSTLLCDSPLCRGGIVVIKFTKSRKLPRIVFIYF